MGAEVLGVGLAAALVRELALVYLVAMLAVAMVSRRRGGRRWVGTVAIVLVVGGLALFHARGRAALIRAGPGQRLDRLRRLGFRVLATLRANPAALIVPAAATMIVVAPASDHRPVGLAPSRRHADRAHGDGLCVLIAPLYWAAG